MGHRLLGYAQDLLRLNGAPTVAEVDAARAGTTRVLEAIVRPDGGLPKVGNSVATVPRALAPAPPDRVGLSDLWLPISGWAVWRDALEGRSADISHVMLTWAKFDGHGHKRADEMSLHLWSRGVDWVTASGYWPYGAPLEAAANSWLGSNAVHEPGEPVNSRRIARLLLTGSSGNLHFADVVRQRASGAKYERQVLQLAPERLLVLDFVHDSPRGSEILWTFDPRLLMAARDSRPLFRSDPVGERSLSMDFDTPVGAISATQLRGSADPFGGWVVVAGEPRRAASILVRHEARDSVIGTLIDVARDHGPTLKVEPASRPERWSVSLRGPDGDAVVRRDGAVIEVLSAGEPPVRLTMQAAPEQAIVESQARISAAYDAAVSEYPPWRDLWFYRVRASWAILSLVAAFEIMRQIAVRWRPSTARRFAAVAPVLQIGIWLAIACVVRFVYLVAG
jgi:hypothetical protein